MYFSVVSVVPGCFMPGHLFTFTPNKRFRLLTCIGQVLELQLQLALIVLLWVDAMFNCQMSSKGTAVFVGSNNQHQK